MSHNPNTVKSQDDLPTTNDGKRSSDVLLYTIDRVIKLEDWKMDMQAKYGSMSSELEKTKKQLEIAVKGIKAVLDDEIFCGTADGGLVMYLYTALERIEELNK